MESGVIIYTVYCFSCIPWFCGVENCCVVAYLNSLLDEHCFWSKWKLSTKKWFQTNTVTKYYIAHWNSVAKIIYSVSIITVQLKLVGAVYVSLLFFRHILAHALFKCPCRRDPHMFLIHPLSLSSLAAHHAAIHTVASHLQAPCFVWSLFCFPWISLQGAELTDLSDWCIGGRLVSYCFPRQRSVASLASLICPSVDVSDSLYCREKWVVWHPKNVRNLWAVTKAQGLLFLCLTWRFLELNFMAVCCEFPGCIYFSRCTLFAPRKLPYKNSHDSMTPSRVLTLRPWIVFL